MRGTRLFPMVFRKVPVQKPFRSYPLPLDPQEAYEIIIPEDDFQRLHIL